MRSSNSKAVDAQYVVVEPSPGHVISMWIIPIEREKFEEYFAGIITRGYVSLPTIPNG